MRTPGSHKAAGGVFACQNLTNSIGGRFVGADAHIGPHNKRLSIELS